MLYCDFTTYKALGGTRAEAEFNRWNVRASSMIDRLTHGRAKRYADDEDIKARLADAAAQIIDILADAAAVRSRGAGLASAATTDGYSETFVDAAAMSRQTQANAFYALRDAFGSDPYGLCYLGVE